MRNIKFRAWHKELRIMVNFDFKSLFDDDGYIEIEYYKFNPSADYLIIMQYLGEDCKDYNETELCEGDIIEAIHDANLRKEIIFKDGCFGLMGRHDQFYPYEVVKKTFLHKKIGNIHQNPELLEDKYQPKFKPKVYLRFLNSVDNHVRVKKCDDYNDNQILSIELWSLLWDGESTIERIFKGNMLEECLDQAILATGFEKELK